MKLTVSLSRAHAIVSRIGTEMAAVSEQISPRAAMVSYSAAPTASQAASLKDAATGLRDAIDRYAQLSALQAEVREVIAQSNVLAGVSAILSKIEANKRVIAMYAKALDAAARGSTAVHVDELEVFTWPAPGTYGPSEVVITALPADFAQVVQDAKRRLERENFRLSDELAERNLAPVELSIPDQFQECLAL